MFNSGTTVTSFLSNINDEVDIATSIPTQSYYRFISTLEQRIYGGLAKFERKQTITLTDGKFALSSITHGADELAPSFEDILKVYGNGKEYTRCGVIGAFQFTDKNTYALNGNDVDVNSIDGVMTVVVVTRVKPKIVSAGTDVIHLPPEWIDIAYSYVRGEAYKLANDDAQASKWITDYNSLVESFKEWISVNMERFGE